jgi:cold shock CspA family protein
MEELKSGPHKVKHSLVDSLKIEGKYYRGRIARFNPKTGYGFVETPKGDHIFFYIDQIRLEGKNRKKADIRPGRLVGFDVGWTDRGLRVCKLNIFDEESIR